MCIDLSIWMTSRLDQDDRRLNIYREKMDSIALFPAELRKKVNYRLARE